jgi:hypothetical protein
MGDWLEFYELGAISPLDSMPKFDLTKITASLAAAAMIVLISSYCGRLSRGHLSDGSAPSVRTSVSAADRSQVKSLMEERDELVMIQRAQAAGFIVEKLMTSSGVIYKVIDPATNAIVMTRSIME